MLQYYRNSTGEKDLIVHQREQIEKITIPQTWQSLVTLLNSRADEEFYLGKSGLSAI